MYTNIRIVLVNTYHPGNIGAAARAMKTMGIERLYLVNPREFPSEKATAMAAGATDVLEHALTVASLEHAIEDCTFVVGTSARKRSFPWPQRDVRTAAQNIASASSSEEIAIVFGPETTGLSNEDLRQCHYHLYIPGNPQYSVLNIAQAVQICCHEVFMALRGTEPTEGSSPAVYPQAKEMN